MSKEEKAVAQTDESELSAASALACLAQNDRVEEEEHEDDSEDFTIPQRFTKSGRKRAVPFTIKLLKVLSDKRNAHIITWMPSGRSFSILKPKTFVADILPKHFKTAKFSSFTRKLHRWNFQRHYRGEEAGAFYHEDFQRGRLDLVEKMTCHKSEPPKSTAPVQKAAIQKKVAAKPAAAKKQPPLSAAKPEPKPMPTPTLVRVPAAVNVPEAQAHVSLPPPLPTSLPHQATQRATPIDTERLSAERLNAAIELEVNRRLKERITAVALSRHAFAISALRQQQLVPSASQLAALMLKKQSSGQPSNSNTPFNFSSFGYRALPAEGQPSAPPTNIQGARTA